MVTLVRKPRKNFNLKYGDRMVAKTVAVFSVIGELPCPLALDIARKFNVAPRIIGDTANRLKIKIINCQLGCSDVRQAKHDSLENLSVDGILSKELQTSQPDRGLPCKEALEIVGKLKASREKIGDAVSKLKIRIVDCQLGYFP